jgi:sphingolipid delta-4 desaturase
MLKADVTSIQGFQESDLPEPHRSRALEIIGRRPELRELFGRNPATLLLVLAVVAFQLGVAYLLRDAAWWLILVFAWCVGAFATHATFCLYHECAHQLVFRKKWANDLLGIFTNLPQLLPSYAAFRIYHLKHHQYQGDPDLDADLASGWEARLIGHSMAGKVLWELFFPFFQVARSFRFSRSGRISLWNGWVALNIAVQAAFVAGLLLFLPKGAFFYLLASFFFSVGLHPLGARWVQEHFVVEEGHETYSYYGPGNRIAMNIGYHNEHHDFPFVPWSRLPRLKAAVPEVYDTLPSHRSWSRLWIRFLTDPKLSLFSRVSRDGRLNLKREPLPKAFYAPASFDEKAEGAV